MLYTTNMKDGLFINFLNDPGEYDCAVAFWQKLVREVLEKRFGREEWCEWLNTKFVDGTPFRDGNPIASFVSKPKRRGIKIIQLSEVQPHKIDASVQIFALGDDEEMPYLEIRCFLTLEAAELSKQLIAAWVGEDEVFSSIDATIRDICSK